MAFMELLNLLLNNLESDNHLTLTPNKRIKAFLLDKYKDYSYLKRSHITASNLKNIPNLYNIKEWIEFLWNELKIKKFSQKIYLSPFQELLIFEKIIKNSKFFNTQLNLLTIAKLAIEAWKYCREYRVNISDLKHYAKFNLDYEAFYCWILEYKKICDENNWVDFIEITDIIIQSIKIPVFDNLPKKISLIAFDDLSLQYNELLQALSENGVLINYAYIAEENETSCFIKLSDQKTEIFSALAWAKEQVLKYSSENVAVVIPNIMEVRNLVFSQAKIVFENEDDYNILAPLPLSKYQIIEYAFSLLEFSKNIISFDNLSYVLRSPFINLKSFNQFDLVELEIFFRQFKSINFNFSDLIKKIELFEKIREEEKEKREDKEVKKENNKEDKEKNKSEIKKQKIASENYCKDIANEKSFDENENNEFKEYFAIFKNEILNKKLELKEWVIIFKKILTLFGWEVNHQENVIVKEILISFNDLLEKFLELSFIFKKITFNEAYNLLVKLANNTLFLPSLKQNAKINILGVLEATGVLFDAVWVTNFCNDKWPNPPNPNSFLPLELQKKYNIPKSSFEKELIIAKNITSTLKKSGKFEVIFSYPEVIDNKKMVPSILIKNLEEKKLLEIIKDKELGKSLLDQNNKDLILNFGMNIKSNFALNLINEDVEYKKNDEFLMEKKNIGKNKKLISKNFEMKLKTKEINQKFFNALDNLEFIKDDEGGQLQDFEKLKKGATIIKLQANCPFRAYAEIRLNAYKLEDPTFIITKRERGEILHNILYLFWEKTRNLTNLKKLDKKSLIIALKKIIEKSFARFILNKTDRFKNKFFNLEKQRTLEVVLNWLNLEKNRENFSVEFLEKKQPVKIGPISFNLRVDRIDKIGNSDYLLIDYKTSNVNFNDWFTDKIIEPQLPLYAVSSELKFSAISFAIIKADEQKFKGISKRKNILPNVLELSKVKKIKNAESAENVKTESVSKKSINGDSFVIDDLWNKQINLWKINLKRIAKEFFDGKADVLPRDKNLTCKYCHLSSFCRVDF